MDELVGRMQRTLLQRCVHDLVAQEAGLHGAMFCSSDGFELASCLPSSVSADSLAAMASSQIALGEAMCRETDLENCRDLVVNAASGAVLLMVVPGTDNSVVLAAIGNTKHTLGQVLFTCKQAIAEIGSRFAEAQR